MNPPISYTLPTVELAAERLRVIVAPKRGGEIRFVGTGSENLLAVSAEDHPLPASRSVSYGDSKLDFLSEYRGGWQELFPNAGAACVVNGIPHPFHGEIAWAQMAVLEVSDTRIVLRSSARMPLQLTRTMWIDSHRPVLRIEEAVLNRGPSTEHFLWGHHPAFAVSPGTRVDMPARRVICADIASPSSDLAAGSEATWPLVVGNDEGVVDLSVIPPARVSRFAYLDSVEAGWMAIRDCARSSGVALAWDKAAFPHAWYWLENATPDFPWYGGLRLLAIEPQSSWPSLGLERAIAAGLASRLDPGEERTAWLTLVELDQASAPVHGVTRDGDVATAEPLASHLLTRGLR